MWRASYALPARSQSPAGGLTASVPPTVDISVLLDIELSEQDWKELPTSRRRDLLTLAIREVLLLDQDLPPSQQFTIWWHGEKRPVHR